MVSFADITIGPRPDGAFADESRHRAYIPSGGDGTLAVIDTSGPAAAQDRNSADLGWGSDRHRRSIERQRLLACRKVRSTGRRRRPPSNYSRIGRASSRPLVVTRSRRDRNFRSALTLSANYQPASDGDLRKDCNERSGLDSEVLSKVPAVTLGFWIIKILATTLGETGGDTVTMTWLGETTAHPVPNGYLIGTAIFGLLLVVLVLAQIRARSVQSVAVLGDDRRFDDLRHDACRLRRPLAGHRLSRRFAAAARLRAGIAVCLVPDGWNRRREHHHEPARGDILLDHDHLLADARHRAGRLDRRRGPWLFWRRRWCSGPGLAVLAVLYFATNVCRVFLFWAAFILTRPLGATVGDFLDKPVAKGGLELSRPIASAALAVVIVALILLIPQRPGSHPGKAELNRCINVTISA